MTLEFRPFVPSADHPTFRDGVKLMQENFPDASATSPDFLRWLYLENPYGKAKGYLAYDGETPVAQIFLAFQGARLGKRAETVAVAVNGCTASTHRRQGLYEKIFRLLIEDARRDGLPFILAFPNPSTRNGVLKAGLQIVKDSCLEIAFPSLPDAVAAFFRKEKISVLGETEDLPWPARDLPGFVHVPWENANPRPSAFPGWHIPFDRTQLLWRYAQHPTRKYYLLRHEKTGALVVVRFFRLFNVKACAILKTDARDSKEWHAVLKSLRRALRSQVACVLKLESEDLPLTATSPFHGRFGIPLALAPRRFPLAIYPLREDFTYKPDSFAISFGDYDVL